MHRYELQAKLHVDGNYRFSLDTLELIMRRGLTASAELPLDPLVKMAAMRLAFEHHKNGKLESAASVLRTFVQATDARGAADYDASNLLAECWAALERWNDMFEFLCSLQNQRYHVTHHRPVARRAPHASTAAASDCLQSCFCTWRCARSISEGAAARTR